MQFEDASRMDAEGRRVSLVLYCLLRRKRAGDGQVEFLVIHSQRQMTFPPTKLRPEETLYQALVRIETDLQIPHGSIYPEAELDMVPNEGETRRYPGLTQRWFLYPVDLSMTREALEKLDEPADHLAWWTLDEIQAKVSEPNIQAMAAYLRKEKPELLREVHAAPSMDAQASYWSAQHEGGVRIVRGEVILNMIETGSHAFNLRVADPYLPYQKQGLGFTWSFFSSRDTQDVHVHGMPAVEIYGVLQGRLQLWHKPMNHRGARTWQCETLGPGDWAEVEPLHCHFACWVGPEGLGTVIKAAASGELGGVGKIGEKGKTTCKDCNVKTECAQHPQMIELTRQYKLPFAQRDYQLIASLAEGWK